MASGTIALTKYGTSSSGELYGQVVWSATSNGTAANTSTVTASVQLKRQVNFYTTGTWTGALTIGNTTKNISWYGKVASSWVTVATLSATIAHQSDGTGACYIFAQANGPSGTSQSGVYVKGEKSVSLDTIARYATILSAPNFTDIEKPTITYSNPAGSNVTSLQACITLDGSNPNVDASVAVAYRNIPVNGTSYTFNDITADELYKIHYATTGSNSRKVWFKIKTVIGNSSGSSQLERTFTIANPKPTINPTIIDTDSAITAITGNNKVLVRYYSNASIAVNAAAVKAATLVSVKTTCAGRSPINGVIENVDSDTFVFYARDNRGNETTKTITSSDGLFSFVNYVRLTCNLDNNMPDSEGNLTLKVTGNYFNGSIGKTANSLTVKYRYKPLNGSYGSWNSMTIYKNGHKYSATASITGLDYQSAYVFQAYAVDALGTLSEAYSAEKVVKANPIFDWGENDFNFNVPVNIDSQLSANSIHLNEQTITVKGDLNTYYPVHIETTSTSAEPSFFFLKKNLRSLSPAWEGNHSTGTSSCAIGWMWRSGGWDGNGLYINTLYSTQPYAKLVSHILANTMTLHGFTIWLRGGTASYNLSCTTPFTATIYYENTDLEPQDSYEFNVGPRTDIGNGGIMHTNIPINLDGTYPVNSIYIGYSHTSPASLFGGTWTRITSTFLYATTSSGVIGETGYVSTATSSGTAYFTKVSVWRRTA